MAYKCPEHVFLHADHISKIYPGTKALDDVSFDLLKGKVNVLIGENGAGKSTLMKMIAGIEHPSEGTLYIGDQEVAFKDRCQKTWNRYYSSGIKSVSQSECVSEYFYGKGADSRKDQA